MSDFETITVTVREVNSPPFLASIGGKSLAEGDTLTFTATATDPDVPANTLRFRLDSAAPAGASIDPVSGDFTWTPTEAQGPGAYSVTVEVSDNGSPSLVDIETITITVGEQNLAPTLSAISDQMIDELTELRFTATATDPDSPANVLSFSLGTDAPLAR